MVIRIAGLQKGGRGAGRHPKQTRRLTPEVNPVKRFLNNVHPEMVDLGVGQSRSNLDTAGAA
jgi:hypothetical protein